MSGSPFLLHRVYATALFAAPLLLSAAMLTDITPQADNTKELLTLIAEQPGAWSTGQLLFFLSALAWVPAGLGLIRMFGRRTALGRVGGAAVLVGGLAVLPVDAAGLYLPELATSGASLEQQAAIVESVESSPAVIGFEIVHVVGLFVGLLVVAVALLRTRLLPTWAPLALVAAFLGLLAAPNQVVTAIAMAFLVLGLGAAGIRLFRISDQESSVTREIPANRPLPF